MDGDVTVKVLRTEILGCPVLKEACIGLECGRSSTSRANVLLPLNLFSRSRAVIKGKQGSIWMSGQKLVDHLQQFIVFKGLEEHMVCAVDIGDGSGTFQRFAGAAARNDNNWQIGVLCAYLAQQ